MSSKEKKRDSTDTKPQWWKEDKPQKLFVLPNGKRIFQTTITEWIWTGTDV